MNNLSVIYLCAGNANRALIATKNKMSKHNLKNQFGTSVMDWNLSRNQFDKGLIITKSKFVNEYKNFIENYNICGLSFDTKEVVDTLSIASKIYFDLHASDNDWITIYCGDNVFNEDVATKIKNLISTEDLSDYSMITLTTNSDTPIDFINKQADGSWVEKSSTYVSNEVMCGVWVVRAKDLETATFDNISLLWDWFNKNNLTKKIYAIPVDDWLDVGTEDRIIDWESNWGAGEFNE